MLMFATMTLTGAQVLQPIALVRGEAFLAHQYDIRFDERVTGQTGNPRYLPRTDSGHFSLELGAHCGG